MYSAAISLVFLFLFQVAYAQSGEITIKECDIPTPNSLPHDIVVGQDGMIWFTEIGANKIGKFDPNTEQFSEYTIPTASSRPHGLVVGNDGNVWFPNYNNNKIGVILATLEEKAAPSTAVPKSEELEAPEQEVGLEDQVTNSAIAGITIAIIATAAIVAFLRIRYKKQ